MQYVMAAVIGVGGGFLAFCLLGPLIEWFHRPRVVSSATSENERRFRSVFSIMDEARRQSLIKYYADKFGCNADQAMMHAVQEWKRDANRW
ncbi:hypothetical protein [Rhizobium tubonense]|nr:hypothetical protein [Rhizobium tubonense]